MLEYLMNKYGIRLTRDELAKELKIPLGTIKNKPWQISNGLNLYRDGRRTFINSTTVAEYLEKLGSNK